MWKPVFIVALAGLRLTRVSAGVIADGHKQIGAPFKFQRAVSGIDFAETNSEVWWPAKGRPPQRHFQRPRFDEQYEAAMHTDVTFPNPFEEPEKCVSFPNLAHSWVCDPDRILSAHEQRFIENRLLKLRDTTPHMCNENTNYYQAAAAVASDIVVGENETPQEATDKFANALLRKWGIGNKGCHDGIVLVFVKNLHTVSLATRENVDDSVASKSFKSHLQKTVKSIYIDTGNPGAAVAAGVELVNRHLPQPAFGLSWTATVLLTLAGAYMASVGGVYYSLNSFLTKRYTIEE